MVELERIYDEHRFPVTSECKRQVNVTGKYFNIKERQLLEGCAVYAVIHDPAFRLIGAGRQLNTLEFVRLVGYFGKYEVHSLDPVWRRLSGHVADGERVIKTWKFHTLLQLAWRSVRFPNNKHPIGGMPKRDQNASRPIGNVLYHTD